MCVLSFGSRQYSGRSRFALRGPTVQVTVPHHDASDESAVRDGPTRRYLSCGVELLLPVAVDVGEDEVTGFTPVPIAHESQPVLVSSPPRQYRCFIANSPTEQQRWVVALQVRAL